MMLRNSAMEHEKNKSVVENMGRNLEKETNPSSFEIDSDENCDKQLEWNTEKLLSKCSSSDDNSGEDIKNDRQTSRQTEMKEVELCSETDIFEDILVETISDDDDKLLDDKFIPSTTLITKIPSYHVENIPIDDLVGDFDPMIEVLSPPTPLDCSITNDETSKDQNEEPTDIPITKINCTPTMKSPGKTRTTTWLEIEPDSDFEETLSSQSISHQMNELTRKVDGPKDMKISPNKSTRPTTPFISPTNDAASTLCSISPVATTTITSTIKGLILSATMTMTSTCPVTTVTSRVDNKTLATNDDVPIIASTSSQPTGTTTIATDFSPNDTTTLIPTVATTPSATDVDAATTTASIEADIKKEKRRQVAAEKLKYLIDKLHAKIKKLEEQELTLDEMGDESVYTHLELYKKKLVLAWKKYCELTKQPSNTGREIEKPFVFKDTKYPQINKAITRFVNKYNIFPDYQDIYDVVSTCNDFFNMNLSKQAISSISGNAFTVVGKTLKSRRMIDYKKTFGCHITDQSESMKDPAMGDSELRKKLEENKKKAASNLEKAFHHFETLPDKPQEDSGSDNGDNDSCDESDDDDDDEEKGISSKHNNKTGLRRESGNTAKKKKGDKKLNKTEDSDSSSDGASNQKEMQSKIEIEIDSDSSSSSDDKERRERKSFKTTSSNLEKESDVSRKKANRKTSSGSSEAIESEIPDSLGSVEIIDSDESESRQSPTRRSSVQTRQSAKHCSSNSSSISSNGSSNQSSHKKSSTRKRSPSRTDLRSGEMVEPGGTTDSLKRRKICDGTKINKRSGPVFVRLIDEINKFKISVQNVEAASTYSMKSDTKEENIFQTLIQKALSPSKVVLRNCLDCKVKCQREPLSSSYLETVSPSSVASSVEKNKSKSVVDKETKVNSDGNKNMRKHRNGPSNGSKNKKQCNSNTTNILNSIVERSGVENSSNMRSQSSQTEINYVEETNKKPTSSLSMCCLTLSDSDASEIDANTKEDSTLQVQDPSAENFPRIVGEVMDFSIELHYEGNDGPGGDKDTRKKDDEGLRLNAEVMATAQERNATDETRIDKQIYEIVDVDENDSRNEDGVIFVSSYNTSHPVTSSNISQHLSEVSCPSNHFSPVYNIPSMSHVTPISSSSRFRNSSANISKTPVYPTNVFQKKSIIRPMSRRLNNGSVSFFNPISHSTSQSALQCCGSSVPQAVSTVQHSSISGGANVICTTSSSVSNNDLMATLLDPSMPVPNVQVPKLPANVVKQINKMTRQLTNAGRGRSRSIPAQKQKQFRGFAPKHLFRNSFSAGAAGAANLSRPDVGFVNRRTYINQNSMVGGTSANEPSHIFSNVSRKRNFQRVPVVIESNSGPMQTPTESRKRQNKAGGSRNQEGSSLSVETVIIEDEDSMSQDQNLMSPRYLQDSGLMSLAAKCSMAQQRCASTMKSLTSSGSCRIYKGTSRNVTPHSSFSVNRMDARQQISINSLPKLTPQQRKMQEKTQSSDSDVILCGVDFDTNIATTTTQIQNVNNSQTMFILSRTTEDVTTHGQNMLDANKLPLTFATTTLAAAVTTEVIAVQQSTSVQYLSSQLQQHVLSSITTNSPVRSLKRKTLSSDSDVILCEDAEETTGMDTGPAVTALGEDQNVSSRHHISGSPSASLTPTVENPSLHKQSSGNESGCGPIHSVHNNNNGDEDAVILLD